MGTRRYAFIRAINTGTRRLTNDAVIEPFAALGLEAVQAYQAAGNVAFVSDEEPEALTSQLEAGRAITAQAHLNQLGDMEPDEWPASMKEFMA